MSEWLSNPESLKFAVAICMILMGIGALIIGILIIKDEMVGRRKLSEYLKIARTTKRKVKNDPGTKGEFELYSHLEELENDGCRFLFNTYIPSYDGSHYTEVDMIILSRHGMCVIECKNYKGKVVGNKDDQNWEQTFPKQRYPFFNPIKQNAGHIHAIWDMCRPRVGYIPTWSLIAFSDLCDISDVKCDDKNVRVLNFSDAKDAIVDSVLCSNAHMSDKNVETLYRMLKSCSNTSKAVKRKHRRYVSGRAKEARRS